MPSRCAISISRCEGTTPRAHFQDEPSQRLAQILARVAGRDRQAFRTLYDLTSDRLYGVAISLLHDRARAEEVLQDAYVRIWQRATQFDAAVARPMTWLITIVRNRAIDLLRAERQERASTVAWSDEHGDRIAALAPPPEQQLQRALEAAQIDRSLRALPRQQRHALALVLYRGMTHSEVASAARVPLGTAKAWVRRGLASLQRCIDAAPTVQ
jgi:RNA polymerase sigma-70 factor, ECF subfamily